MELCFTDVTIEDILGKKQYISGDLQTVLFTILLLIVSLIHQGP